MKTMWNEQDRRVISERVATVGADAPAKWGRMNAPQMMAHLTDCLRMALGDLAVEPKRLPIRYPPLKQLIVYAMPFPKGAPTAPELISRVPASWSEEVNDLTGLVDRFGREPRTRAWPDHPAFGTMTAKSWGVLVYRHMDHHLRQFGV